MLDAGWTDKSDVYDIGYLIKVMEYGNAPVINLLEWSTVSNSRGRHSPEKRRMFSASGRNPAYGSGR